jgi:hypothetical protein
MLILKYFPRISARVGRKISARGASSFPTAVDSAISPWTLIRSTLFDLAVAKFSTNR